MAIVGPGLTRAEARSVAHHGAVDCQISASAAISFFRSRAVPLAAPATAFRLKHAAGLSAGISLQGAPRTPMLAPELVDEALVPFFKKHLITDIRQTIKSGKEATVFLCDADPSVGVEYLVAKIYRPRENRTFKNDAIYHAGEYIGDKRTRKA